MATLAEIMKLKIGEGKTSKAYLAHKLGVTERTVENYMHGKRKPDPEALIIIAEVLGFQLNELSVQNVPQETVSPPNKETRLSTEEAWFRRLDQLIENNRMLSEAQLLLAEHINSNRAAKDALSLLEEEPGPMDATQRPASLGKQGIDSVKTRVKGKGNE